MAWRRAFVRAADQLISAGQLVHRRRAFEAVFEAIMGLGERLFKVWQHQSKGARQRRGGAVQDLGVTLEPPVSGAYLHHLFSPGIWWIGFRMNLSGSAVQILQMYS